jgi:YHS domain-containing protein
MKKLKLFTAAALLVASLSARLVVAADNTNDTASSTNAVVKPYPLTTCVVDGMKLNSMGSPYVFIYHGQQVKLCCKDCQPVFLKNPDVYMKKIQDAGAASKK